MGRIRDQVRACARCGESFGPTREAQREYQRCRRRLALECHAHKRVGELIQLEGALMAGLGIAGAELDRWRNVAAGSPRKRGGCGVIEVYYIGRTRGYTTPTVTFASAAGATVA